MAFNLFKSIGNFVKQTFAPPPAPPAPPPIHKPIPPPPPQKKSIFDRIFKPAPKIPDFDFLPKPPAPRRSPIFELFLPKMPTPKVPRPKRGKKKAPQPPPKAPPPAPPKPKPQYTDVYTFIDKLSTLEYQGAPIDTTTYNTLIDLADKNFRPSYVGFKEEIPNSMFFIPQGLTIDDEESRQGANLHLLLLVNKRRNTGAYVNPIIIDRGIPEIVARYSIKIDREKDTYDEMYDKIYTAVQNELMTTIDNRLTFLDLIGWYFTDDENEDDE